ncbi:UBX domain-containing protein 4 isoform X4 [Fundulus heteroclitus]|uniref:UBX domain-containing protein 4 isoform X4 n=2 Tax=Fundulus heteroclitus TaxID=8078 RepID=UPI00165A502B|nr:UBX domain-containing protein 4 isoform X4 [Fundulus heteroclitus]
MLWFDGSIPEAIHCAKQRSLVFVVVIAGEDEQSKQLMSSWEDDSISEAAQNCCVAIKVDAKSDTCVQFSQIYPVVCIPSSFFIGVSGIPLEVIAGSVTPDVLMKRINKVKKMHSQGIGGSAVTMETRPPDNTEPTSDPEVPVGAGASPGSLFTISNPTKGSLSSSVDEDSVSSAKPSMENSLFCQATCSESENPNSKIERLTKKLEERHEQKKKEQKEDRAERAATYARLQQDEKVAKQNLLQAKQADQDARKELQIRERSTISRIQFRLPDGSSLTNQFPSQTRLQEAWNFAFEEIGSLYGNFSLATMYPRQEFTSEDLNKTLLELKLVPSASIVLLPSQRPTDTVTRSSGFGIWAVLGSILYPLLAVWRFLSSFLFAAPYSASASRGEAEHNSSISSANQAKRETSTKQKLEMRPKDFKKEGKICTLRTEDDNDDEDNNTWNGNSTQQM